MGDEARKPGLSADELDGGLAELARGDAELEGLDALYADVRARIERDDEAPGAGLRALSTARRRALAACALGLFGVLGGVMLARPHLAARSPGPLAATLGLLCVLSFASAMLCLRAAHRPPLPAWATAAWVLTAVVTASAVLLASSAPQSGVAATAPGSLPCLAVGLMLGLPVYFVLRLLDRGGTPHAVAGALAAGLVAVLLLELHCPVRAPIHLMVGHVGVVLAFVGLHYARSAGTRRAD
jgi:drug/metabolite transporter (DMT)-like permease